MELYMGNEARELTDQEVSIGIDGVTKTFKPGDKVVLRAGQSITLKPYVYHKFYGEAGNGKVLIGEVSSVSDDENDNCFYEGVGRFPDIEEDEPPVHLLVSDYKKYL
jgi:D-lyxose ketol-isomerase